MVFLTGEFYGSLLSLECRYFSAYQSNKHTLIIVDLGLEKRETITKKWLLVGLRWPRFVTISWRKHGGVITVITWILVKRWHQRPAVERCFL